jgi:triphosphoribosyl-dephospho-CoA synthase
MNLAEQIEISCLMEATARKPGNVHPVASFVDLDYDDFVCAAQAIGRPLASVQQAGLGQSVWNAIAATQREARSNVNLGIALLIAPLAAVPSNELLQSGIREILAKTTVDDAEQVYAAIRLAVPGGLGKADSQDVRDRPTITLRDAMALAAERDRIAEQYSTDFAYVLGIARPWLVESWRWCHELNNVLPKMGELLGLPGVTSWEAALIRFELKLLADAPDSLVARKCGLAVATELQQRAADVHHLDWPSCKESWPALHRFDHWLRENGHRRNPGTTADLIAATLFAAIRDGLLEAPSREAVLHHADHIRQTSVTRVQHDH